MTARAALNLRNIPERPAPLEDLQILEIHQAPLGLELSRPASNGRGCGPDPESLRLSWNKVASRENRGETLEGNQQKHQRDAPESREEHANYLSTQQGFSSCGNVSTYAASKKACEEMMRCTRHTATLAENWDKSFFWQSEGQLPREIWD